MKTHRVILGSGPGSYPSISWLFSRVQRQQLADDGLTPLYISKDDDDAHSSSITTFRLQRSAFIARPSPLSRGIKVHCQNRKSNKISYSKKHQRGSFQVRERSVFQTTTDIFRRENHPHVVHYAPLVAVSFLEKTAFVENRSRDPNPGVRILKSFGEQSAGHH